LVTAPDAGPDPAADHLEALTDRVRRLVLLWAARRGVTMLDGRVADIIACELSRPDAELAAVARAAISASSEARTTLDAGGTDALRALVAPLTPGASS
jgi:hypothetical protein